MATCESTGSNETPDLRLYSNIPIGKTFDKSDYCDLINENKFINCGNNGEFKYGGDTDRKCRCRGDCSGNSCRTKKCVRVNYSGLPEKCCATSNSYYNDMDGTIRTCAPIYRKENRHASGCKPYMDNIPSNEQNEDITMMDYCKDDKNFFKDNGQCDKWINYKRRINDGELVNKTINFVCSKPNNMNRQKCQQIKYVNNQQKPPIDISSDIYNKNDITMSEYCNDNKSFFTKNCEEWIDAKQSKDKSSVDSLIKDVCSRPENVNEIKCGCIVAGSQSTEFPMFNNMPVQCMHEKCKSAVSYLTSDQMSPCLYADYGDCKLGYDDMKMISSNPTLVSSDLVHRCGNALKKINIDPLSLGESTNTIIPYPIPNENIKITAPEKTFFEKNKITIGVSGFIIVVIIIIAILLWVMRKK